MRIDTAHVRLASWHLLVCRHERYYEDAFTLWKISMDGGDPVKLKGSQELLKGLNLHPNGQQIAYHTWRSEEDVCVMENFLPE